MHGHADLVRAMAPVVTKAAAAEVVVCPPYPYLAACVAAGMVTGGQDCHAQAQGAHTGDVSAAMLKELGCCYVIIGHSERRGAYGETDALVAAKAQAALDAGLTPIICVGEAWETRQAGGAEAAVVAQLCASLPKNATDCVVAYEPIWAIGSGKTPGVDEIEAMHAALRIAVPGVKLLYGGSVNAENAKEILSLNGVDGVLVGGASLKPEAFAAIIAASH